MAELLRAVGRINTSGQAVTTTSESSVAPGLPVQVQQPRVAGQLVSLHWGQLTLGTGTTGITPRVRRNVVSSAALVGEANLEDALVAAGQTRPVFMLMVEAVAESDRIRHELSVQQAAATADGSWLQGGHLGLAIG